MNLDEAVAFLEPKGFPSRIIDNRIIHGGTEIQKVAIDGVEDNSEYSYLLQIKDPFIIVHDDNMWIFDRDLGQLGVICKASKELSEVVEAVPWYYAMKERISDPDFPDFILLRTLFTLHKNNIFAEIAPDYCINIKFSQTSSQETDDHWEVIHAYVNGTYPTTHSGSLSLSDDGWTLVIEQTQQDLFFATLEEATQAIVKMKSGD